MRNIWTIAKREFRQYFASPLAYAFGAMLYLSLGIIFFININFGLQTGQITPDGTMTIGPTVIILLFTAPAITMRLLADEQRMGTMELLLTAPVRDWELVIGKWAGALGFMLVVLALTWIYPFIMHSMTSPGLDQGVILSAFIGLTLFVAAILAIGVMVSAMFENPIVAFLVTLAVLLGLWILGGLGSGAGTFNQIAGYISLVDHYYSNFHRGVLDLADSVYFVSLTALTLFIGSQIVEMRRWR